MKLLLTSAGLENKIIRDFATSQISEFKSKTVGVIITGQTAEERIYIDQSLKELRDLGMTTISMNISKDDNFNDLAEFDMYYVCGGNTFYILDRIRKTGVDNILLKAIKKELNVDGESYSDVTKFEDRLNKGSFPKEVKTLITEEIQSGYKLNGKIIRPAKVKVAK